MRPRRRAPNANRAPDSARRSKSAAATPSAMHDKIASGPNCRCANPCVQAMVAAGTNASPAISSTRAYGSRRRPTPTTIHAIRQDAISHHAELVSVQPRGTSRRSICWTPCSGKNCPRSTSTMTNHQLTVTANASRNLIASRLHSRPGIVPRNANGSSTSGADVSLTRRVIPTRNPASSIRPGVGLAIANRLRSMNAMRATSTKVLGTSVQSNGVISSASAVATRARCPSELVADRHRERERAGAEQPGEHPRSEERIVSQPGGAPDHDRVDPRANRVEHCRSRRPVDATTRSHGRPRCTARRQARCRANP